MSSRSDHEQIVRQFFDAYAARTNAALARPPRLDVAGIRNAFAGYFVAASPAGVRGGRNGLLFRLMLRLGFRAYRRMGTRSIDLAGLDVTPIDDMHVMARADWVARYDGSRGDGQDIAFTNHYFLQVRDGQAKVFAYVTPDEQAALREHGLIG